MSILGAASLVISLALMFRAGYQCGRVRGMRDELAPVSGFIVRMDADRKGRAL